ncbi:amino acid ABC transporter substrate-binding protein [Streptomyces inhibens]|uniref:Amino acid ABC transporter substrate-binding protein n=1 Tax=Streptomyces inhibens TaxID=2293571 RepID=A0A371PRP2_STRIH|nr:ABC transporter substrate-binding protein [Streptomyces inhibens]REK85167.1 amino acid ABC transporter substrate-binding protein [Streptomyces inhibens]
MRLANRPLQLAVCATVVLLTAAVGCAPQDASPGGSRAAGQGKQSCDRGKLATVAAGKLTVGTDKPAYAPWFHDDDPANGKGFESAVAYAVAEQLGYGKGAVRWQTVPFNNAFAPGEKKFDFDINQISISASRKRAVAFSSGYYDVRQAVIALKGSKAAHAKSIADLKNVKLGAQVGSTSLDVANDTIRPTRPVAPFQKNDFAKSALKNGQVDAILTDLPTAFYITSAEVRDAEVVGQFALTGAANEQFGLVLDKESRITGCVTAAVDALRKDGTLAALEKKWLTDAVDVPVLK